MNRSGARRPTHEPAHKTDWSETFDGSIETDPFGGTCSERIALGRLRPSREKCFCIERQFKLFVGIIRIEFLVRLLRFRLVVQRIGIVVLFRFGLDLWLWFHDRILRFYGFRIVRLLGVLLQLIEWFREHRPVCEG
jgi:hypothetical protein